MALNPSNSSNLEQLALKGLKSLVVQLHTYIHTTKFIERQNREERTGSSEVLGLEMGNQLARWVVSVRSGSKAPVGGLGTSPRG